MKALTALIAICFAFAATAQIPASEKQTLIDFFHSTNGNEWNTTWDLDKPENTWHGVEIKNNTVTAIELGFNNLQGEIPASIAGLKNLESLKLFFNQIGGVLPTEIGALKNLKVLDLNSNNISGFIPVSIGQLKNLEALLLSSNNFTGTLPSDIGRLDKLNTLVIFDNHLFGNFPYAVSKLQNLNELIIANNNFNAESLQASLAALSERGTKIDFDEFTNTTQHTEFATLVLDDDE